VALKGRARSGAPQLKVLVIGISSKKQNGPGTDAAGPPCHAAGTANS
jgi:hypothetical protein